MKPLKFTITPLAVQSATWYTYCLLNLQYYDNNIHVYSPKLIL